MAKKKSHKKFSSLTENPFNIKVNRKKHSILGQKLKGTRGRPIVSHSIGNSKRKEEFHKKRVLSQKSNKYTDKRLLISSQMYDDPATARLVQERKSRFRKNIFNLNDEEILTHKGLPLVNDVSNEVVDDSEDEEPLDSQFVKQAHFGGFSENTVKSRKEIIDEMIVESKMRKQEKKLARKTNADLIEKLDQEWKEKHADTLPILKSNKVEISDKTEKNDPFDILLNELKFEKRTAPLHHLKSPEEIVKKELEKKKQLEEERDKRMNPIEKKEVFNYLSADSIYDGLDIQSESVTDNDVDDIDITMKENWDNDASSESSDESDAEGTGDPINDGTQLEVVENGASDIPNSLEKFINLVNSQDVYDVVENLLKGVIKNKTKQNVEKLENLFSILLEYVIKVVKKPIKALDILDSILPHLYTIAEISPLQTANHLLSLLDIEQENFQACKGAKMKKNFPNFSCLVLFKLISKIYSVSDFRHPVVTPAIIFMCDILSSPYASSYENTVSRFFICKIIYDCVEFSKRYVPEVLFFIHKVLDLTFCKSKKFNLYIDQEITMSGNLDLDFKTPSLISDEIRISILTEVFLFVNQLSVLYTNLESYKEIFSPLVQICSKLPSSHYPSFLKEEISKFINTVNSIKTTYKSFTFVNKKPVPLKLFEPNFESKFTSKKNDIKKKRKLVKSVAQKIKKEERCLLREVRRETQVISSEKLKERIEADEDRKRKVKQLYSALAMQEGEYKKYMKKK